MAGKITYARIIHPKPPPVKLCDIEPDLICIMSDQLKEKGDLRDIKSLSYRDLCYFRWVMNDQMKAFMDCLPYVHVVRREYRTWVAPRHGRKRLVGFDKETIKSLLKLCGVTAPSKEYDYFKPTDEIRV